ncbi:hypothetical protein TWF694_007279 [Orbilia ellipsospora]|uniref:AAA+ ATPase domain-containing protein n=1 Tax=Orbilia ellipsospora TaxID=2528407 RepID=A0AAV9XI63_9PEZI
MTRRWQRYACAIVHYNIEDQSQIRETENGLLYLLALEYVDNADLLDRSVYQFGTFDEVPTVFYAVYSRDVRKVEKWLREGADPNSVAKLPDTFKNPSEAPISTNLPVLAYAILLEEPKIVRVLLSFGAKPNIIPDALRLPYVKPHCYKFKTKTQAKQHFMDHIHQNEETEWCKDIIFAQLRQKLNLTMRYDLHRGDNFNLTKRRVQFAKSPIWDCSPLFRAHFDLVGQEYALKKLLNHILMLTEKSGQTSKPAVFLFAGPSGHGKTELARQMERYLGLPFHSENMAAVKREDEFFGPHSPYRGYEQGSPLNNFLVANNGKRAIVFLDEIEKTSQAILNALLVIFERGASIIDRRGGNRKADISKVIWILATNALDNNIKTFFTMEKHITPELMLKEGRALVSGMRKTLHGRFGAAFTSRIDLILPFFPFSYDEQAVLAHLEIWERREELQRSICLDPKARRLVGNIKLSMEKDYKSCRIISKSYMTEEGVHSIKRAVDSIETDIFEHYLDASNDSITEEDQKIEREYILLADKLNDMVTLSVGETIVREEA